MGGEEKGDWSRYSSRWFRVFLDTVSAEQTQREIAFLRRQLPWPDYARVLDLCCGPGRHALPLAAHGYEVTGIDRDGEAVRRAREARVAGSTFLERDVRAVDELTGTWDAALIMWASFGHFSAAENANLVDGVFRRLRRGGRLVLDVYDRAFFEGRQGEWVHERAGVRVVDRKWLEGDRLHVELQYADGGEPDRFSWQVFTMDELARFVAERGFEVRCACSEFNEGRGIAGDRPRMQWVLLTPE